jgi:hypothetical protein
MPSQKFYNIKMSHCLLGCSDHREPKNISKKRSAPDGIDPGPIQLYIDHAFFFFGDRESRLLTTKHLLEQLLMPLLTTRESVPLALSIALPHVHICENVFGVHATQC